MTPPTYGAELWNKKGGYGTQRSTRPCMPNPIIPRENDLRGSIASRLCQRSGEGAGSQRCQDTSRQAGRPRGGPLFLGEGPRHHTTNKIPEYLMLTSVSGRHNDRVSTRNPGFWRMRFGFGVLAVKEKVFAFGVFWGFLDLHHLATDRTCSLSGIQTFRNACAGWCMILNMCQSSAIC